MLIEGETAYTSDLRFHVLLVPRSQFCPVHTVHHNAVLYCTVLYCDTVLYCTVLYGMIKEYWRLVATNLLKKGLAFPARIRVQNY